MSWILAVAARARRAPELLPQFVQLGADAADENKSAPASSIPLEDMLPESELRNRLPKPQSTRPGPESEETEIDAAAQLMPTSNDDTLHTKGFFSSAKEKKEKKEKKEAHDKKFGYDRIKNVKVESLPQGFPQLAGIISSNDDWAITRGFKNLHVRILVHLQTELTFLETELSELDKLDDYAARYRRRKGNDQEGDTRQGVLLDKIKAKLKEYDDFVLKHAQIQALGRPPQRDYFSVFNWVFEKKPLFPGYYEFIFHSDDFVSTSGCSERGHRPEQSNWFQECIRWCLSSFPCLRRFLKSKTELDKTEDPIVHHYSVYRLALLSKILQVSLTVCILLIPVFLLFLVSLTRLEMTLIVFIFVLFFCVMMSVTSDAKTQEILMGTAAYAAVLVTFIGNLNGTLGFVSGISAT